MEFLLVGWSQQFDLVWAEARPVIVIGDYDRCLHVAQASNVLQCCRILRDVYLVVLDTLLIQRAVSSVALNAGRLRVNRDGHVPDPLWKVFVSARFPVFPKSPSHPLGCLKTTVRGASGASRTNGFNTTSCVWPVKRPQHDVLQVCHSSTGTSTGSVDINPRLNRDFSRTGD